MFNIYGSAPHSPGELPKSVPPRDTGRLWDPSQYLPSSELAQAVNVALALNQPLLVSGEPGTGKTMLGGSVAWNLGLDDPLVFSAKSDTAPRDLYYRFDTLRRFYDAQIQLAQDSTAYVMLQAIGLALVGTLPPEGVPGKLQSQHRGPRRSVVVIDEIDKAPRDVPNDILWELERMSFTIPEAGISIEGDPAFLPIVIFTSNSERSLPDAFLRRCIYHHIAFPDMEQLARIVVARTSLFTSLADRLLREVLDVFASIRSNTTAMRKRPAVAELLDWVRLLEQTGANPERSLFEIRGWAEFCLATLSKTSEDQFTLRHVLATMGNGGGR